MLKILRIQIIQNQLFSFATQDVSHNKYLKLYEIKSNLVDYNSDDLENSIDFTHEKNDMFFGFNASIFETLDDTYDDKYEYVLPEITLDKNLFSNNKIGNLDLQSNYKVHNYDTNKLTNFLVNDLNWTFRDINFNNGINSKFFGNLRKISIMKLEMLIFTKRIQLANYLVHLDIYLKLNFKKILMKIDIV